MFCTLCRDYEVLNHKILLTIVEKINDMQNEDEDTDSELNWSSWIDTDLPDDVDNLEDPDYKFPEEVVESSVTVFSAKKRYNLRHRGV